MNTKKMLAILLSLGMGLSLTACGNYEGETNSTAGKETVSAESKNESGETEKKESEGDVYNIVMEIPTLGSEPSGLAEVEAAINEIVEPEIGVNVTLYPISVSDLKSQTNLMIASGDKLDLVSVIGGLSDYVSKNAFLSLDDLYNQYGQDIKDAEGIAMAGGYYDGKLYAVPSEEKMVLVDGYFARKDMLDELGFTFEEDKVYTADDLSKLFKAFKDKYGEGYYGIAGTGSTSNYYSSFHAVDYLGSSMNTGVLIGAGFDGDTKVTDLFGTPEYEEFANTMYDWAQSGYFSPDASTNTDAATTQIQSGFYLGYFAGTDIDAKMNVSRDCGTEMVPITLVDKYCATQKYQSTMWSIPYNCENPEKTFQFLNMLYADNELDNILTYGLEGISYEVVEKGEVPGQAVIRFADGVNESNSPYHMPLHVYGDKSTISVFEPLTLDYYKELKEFNSSVSDKRKSCTLGYVFNAANVSAQKAAVDAVVSQYTGIISTGAQNPAEILPEFRQALKDAGIEEIVKENQTQLDTWMAEQ